MGSRGPQPTPTEILKLRGSWRANQNRNEPKPESGRPKCPAWLNDDAKKAWRALAPLLDSMNVLTKVDGNALARYCVLWARWRKAEDFIERHGDTYPVKHRGETIFKNFPQVKVADRLSTQLSRLEQSFGLTPAARSRIAAMGEAARPQSEGNYDQNDKRRFLKLA